MDKIFNRAENFWSNALSSGGGCLSRGNNFPNKPNTMEKETVQPTYQIPNPEHSTIPKSLIERKAESLNYEDDISSITTGSVEVYSNQDSANRKNQLTRPRQWTETEDEILKKAVKDHGGKNWKLIAESLRDRSSTQCAQRWRRIQPYKKNQPWTKGEDKLLLDLVKNYGKNWALLASCIEGRTGKQIRERYINRLDPSINRNRFSEEEDEIILEYYKKFGPKWLKISGNLENRPENMVKNRFYSFLRKKIQTLPNEVGLDLWNSEEIVSDSKTNLNEAGSEQIKVEETDPEVEANNSENDFPDKKAPLQSAMLSINIQAKENVRIESEFDFTNDVGFEFEKLEKLEEVDHRPHFQKEEGVGMNFEETSEQPAISNLYDNNPFFSNLYQENAQQGFLCSYQENLLDPVHGNSNNFMMNDEQLLTNEAGSNNVVLKKIEELKRKKNILEVLLNQVTSEFIQIGKKK